MPVHYIHVKCSACVVGLLRCCVAGLLGCSVVVCTSMDVWMLMLAGQTILNSLSGRMHTPMGFFWDFHSNHIHSFSGDRNGKKTESIQVWFLLKYTYINV